MSASGANSFGWSSYVRNPPFRQDLLLEMHHGDTKFVARPCDLLRASVDMTEIWWRWTGIAKIQLDGGVESTRWLNGEPVVLPASDANKSWLCFHCGFETSDEAEAEAHFGDRDDGEEFKPLCRWWARMNAEERVQTLQDAICELNAALREAAGLRISNEGLEYQVNAQEDAIRSYKPFRDCRSINDVFFVYDSMEGRALAAEERLARFMQTPEDGETMPDGFRAAAQKESNE